MSEQGTKYDDGKPRVDLLDPEFMLGVGSVLAFGANKYSAHNWRGGISFSRLIGAALRHLLAIMNGEDRDEESGLPHVHHLGCCVMFLSWMMTHRKDLDDRYSTEKAKKVIEQQLADAALLTCHVKAGSPPKLGPDGWWRLIDKDPF